MPESAPPPGASDPPGSRVPSTSGERSRPPALPPDPAAVPVPREAIDELLRGPMQGPVRVLFLDVDGTLTDGGIAFDSSGADSRRFFIRDGLALQWARDLGVVPVAISGRASRAVEARMADLGIEYHGGIQDKVPIAQIILDREGARWEQAVMVGDDLPDAALMRRVGWPIAVADAVAEVRSIARTVTGKAAGHGAVREVVEMILRHNGTWDRVLQKYGEKP